VQKSNALGPQGDSANKHKNTFMMGLDIFTITDNYAQLYSVNNYDDYNNRRKYHSLSRTFCNFICRRNVTSHEPELEQIGTITNIDINPIYEMENYPSKESLYWDLEGAEDENEKSEILKQAEESKKKYQGNIDKISNTIDELIHKLNSINNLPELLVATDFDTLNNEEYFADFGIDKGDGYINNNFGQDLRNFQRFLEFSKAKSARTVWFTYG